MRFFVKSSTSSPFGPMGRGWHKSHLIAERENVPVKDVDKFVGTLVDADMATLEGAKEKAVKKAKTVKPKNPTK